MKKSEVTVMKSQINILKVTALLIAWTVLTLGATPPALSGEMDQFCSTPPFLGNAVPPNVLIVLDNSGSMNDQAYTGNFNPSQFASGHYYGYFDPTKNYVYSANEWHETALPLSSGTVANPIGSGDLLNWATTRRVDAAKKLLIGGKGNPRTGASVKLDGENSSSSWDFYKEYDSTTTPGLAPFTGNYRFSMSGMYLSMVPDVPDPIRPGSIVFSDNMEAGDGLWDKTGLWHMETGSGSCTNTHGGTGSWYYGQTSPCNYDTKDGVGVSIPNSGDLTTKTIKLPVGTTPQLSFWYYYQTEILTTWDKKIVQISVNNGPFVDLLQLSSDTGQSGGTTAPTAPSWVQQSIDLSAYAGSNVKIRFHFDTGDAVANAFTGWYIDDVTLTASCGISVPATWTLGGTGAPATACDAVDDTGTGDIDATYIQNNSDQLPIILNYNYGGATTGTIANVTVYVRARKTASSGTRSIQAVLRVNGVNYQAGYPGSSSSSLTTSYVNYSFTFTNNPATGLPWAWNEIKALGSGALEGFGVQSTTLPTSNYPRVTQMYMVVTVTAPSGGPYKVVVDRGGNQATGLIDNLTSSARFGLAFYANNSNGGRVENYIDFGSTTTMITAISNMTPSTWTPLGETLYEMVRYFRQDAPYYSNSPADYQVGNNYDPYWFQYSKLSGSTLTDRAVPCAKSFILMLTDGESTQDTSVPTPPRALSWATPQVAGTPRLGGTANGQTYLSSGTDYLIDVAYWGRTTDARTGSKNLVGNQNIVLYPVYLFGRGSTLLKDASIYGGFNDLNGDGKPGPDLKEYLRDSNGDGAVTSADDPLTYYEGDDGYALETSITEAIASILRRAASGTAVSVLTTSSRGVGSLVQAYFLPIKQEGTREVTWTGYTQNLWIDPKDNLREDTVNDYNLKQNEDLAVKLYFDTAANETKAATFTTDADGNGGTLTSCSSPTIKSFSDVTHLWEAGEKLAVKAPSTRRLFTSKKVIREGAAPATTNISVNDFTVANVTGDATLSAALAPNATYTAANIVRYIMGECLETGATGDSACGATANATYRDRRVAVPSGSVNGNTWKLGDIISSTPKVFANTPLNTYHIDYGDSTYYDFVTSDSYKKKSSIALMGANDGVLHAFRVGYLKDTGLAAGIKALFKNFFGTTGTNNIGAPESSDTANDRLGEEVWGYIPFNAFPYLKYLADPTYCHIYYNDLSVRLVDVSIGGSAALNGSAGGTLPTDLRTAGNWKTILIGGMRFGAACSGGTTPAGPPPGAPANVGFSSYYAIDITDPENPVPLWEFTDDDMGYSTDFPSIVRTGDKAQNGNWYVSFGTGSKQLPKGTTDIARSSTGYVYLLNLKTGALVKKVALDHNAIVGDVLAIDAEKDYVSEKIYFGTSYLSTTWKGKIVTIDIPNQDLAAAWTPTIKYLFSDNYPFTSSPDVARDADKNIWVYAGSGKYFSGVDQTDTSGQIFLGIKDAPSGITYPKAAGGLDNRTGTNTTGTVTGTAQTCVFDSTSGTFGFKTIVTSINPTSATPSASAVGWYISLTGGERSITRPLAVGGLVDFLTYVPSSDVCSYGGNSYLYSVGYTTGVAPANVAILAPETTGGTTSGAVTVQKGVLLGPGAPPTGEAIIIPPPKEGQEKLKKKIQIATGVIVEAENEPAISVISKIVHWLKK